MKQAKTGRLWAAGALLCAAGLLLSGCRQPRADSAPAPSAAASAASASAADKNEQDACTVCAQTDTVTLTLYENAAIPYRWVCESSDAAVLRLVREQTVDGDGWALAAGDSPGYHTFVLEWVSDGEVELTLENRRLPEYASGDDAPAERRVFSVRRSGDEVFYEELSPDSEA